MKPNRLLLGLLTAGLALSPSSVVAQTPPAAAPAKKAEPAPTPTTAPKPAESVEQTTLKPATKLEAVEVLGSRIRRIDLEGPSPVTSFGKDEIRDSGALSLADFLRTVPQTYGGVGAGRNSAPSDLNMMAGQRNEGSFLGLTPAPGSSPILGNQVPIQTGVSGVSLRGLGSGSTLVLVDGRRVAQSGVANRGSATGQGFVDINSIPLGMIERVEIITDGASAIYGSDAVAGVINVVLKKNWSGSEVTGTVKFTQHGGARERQTTVVHGFAFGRLRGTVALDYFDREPLYSSQRAFTKSMNFSDRLVGYNAAGVAVYGADQRIQMGYPASIQAVATTGFVSIPGIRVLLAPEGSATTPPISAFIPRTTNAPGQTSTAIIAQGQRVTNPAPFVQLVSAPTRYGATGKLSYDLGHEMEAYLDYSFSDSRSLAKTLPAYAQGNIAAAFNPFGENITILMLLPKWGQLSQQTKTQTDTVTAGLRGKLGATWRWDTGVRWQDQRFRSITRAFNQTAFNALLISADPAQRFNPYIDERAPGAIDQTALLTQMAIFPLVRGKSGLTSFDFSANGDVLNIWGGPVKMAFGGTYEKDRSDTTSVAYSGFPVVATATTYNDRRTTRAAYSELSVPIVGKPNTLPLIRRLEVNLAGRIESLSDAGTSKVPKYGLTWVPITSLLLRGSYSEGFRPPSLTEDRRNTTTSTSTINDPLRGGEPALVTVVGRSNPDLRAEKSTNEFYGFVFEPPFIKNLSLTANFYRTKQKDAVQTFGTTLILNNPALFPGFVIRDQPSAADTAAGRPGVVTQIYNQLGNFGLIQNDSVDYGAEYRLPWEKIGRWRLGINAARTLKATRQLVIGGPVLDDSGDTFASPKWNISSKLAWSAGSWSVTFNHSYMSGYRTNQGAVTPTNFPTPPVRMTDMQMAYVFKNGVWRKYGKDLRLGFGISNLTDAEPPFLNNIYGFNPNLHGTYVFGRTFLFSFSIPL